MLKKPKLSLLGLHFRIEKILTMSQCKSLKERWTINLTTDNMEEEDLANRNRLVPKKRLLQSFNHFVAEEEDNPSVGKKNKIKFFKYYYYFLA